MAGAQVGGFVDFALYPVGSSALIPQGHGNWIGIQRREWLRNLMIAEYQRSVLDGMARVEASRKEETLLARRLSEGLAVRQFAEDMERRSVEIATYSVLLSVL